MSKRTWNFNPEAEWHCTWQDKEYGTWGTLPKCLNMTQPYHDCDTSSPYRNRSEVIDVLAKFGSASGFWWSIEYDNE